MRECLKFGWLLAAGAIAALGAPAVHPTARATSVVRADLRTGRLVRAVVAPRPRARSARPAAPAPAAVSAVIEETARRYDVDPLLVHSLIQVESAYDVNALSHKGAQGLMQLIPGTARRFGVNDVWDFRQNIEGGVRYLSYLKSLFPNDLRLTLAAYNAGEGAVWKYGNSVPPYRETRDYVVKVGERYDRARRRQQTAQQATGRPALASESLAAIERYAPIEHYVDSKGRLHIRTRHVDTP